MAYPDLGTWNERRPQEAEEDAVEIAEGLAWAALDSLTAGQIVTEPVVVRPTVLETDGSVLLATVVGGIEVIRIDGFVFNRWQRDGRHLIRLDGETWPVNTDMSLASGDEGTFEVTYYPGFRPGRLLTWAAAELAAEFYAAAAGKKCRLPKNVTAVTRQGVSFEMQTPYFDEGKTGIHEIDVILTRYNPQHQRSLATVTSPESITRAPRRY